METQPKIPARLPAIAALLVATVAFGAVGLVTSMQGGRGSTMAAPAVITALAAFCILFPDTRGFGLLLTWNALGLGVGFLVIGLISVGALMVFPVVVLALALSVWPRLPDEALVTWPTHLALIGGVTVVLGFALVMHQRVGM